MQLLFLFNRKRKGGKSVENADIRESAHFSVCIFIFLIAKGGNTRGENMKTKITFLAVFLTLFLLSTAHALPLSLDGGSPGEIPGGVCHK